MLDLRADEVASVLCTGFTGDFSWLDPALVDADGQPRHQDTAAPAPGVWYVGLRWLIRRSSGILLGFPRDAADVAAASGRIWTADPGLPGDDATPAP